MTEYKPEIAAQGFNREAPIGKCFDFPTLRDQFAMAAMQGMLAACTGWSERDQERLASCSYKMADEMMKERSI